MTPVNRRQVLRSGLPLLASAVGACGREASTPASPGVPRLGMNVTGLVDWASELPFADVFRTARDWISQRQGADWGKGPPLALDEAGWVKSLEPGCYAETPMCSIEGGHYPGGRYSVYHEGKGELEFWGSARIVEQSSGLLAIDVKPSTGAPIWLRLRRTDPSDPLRNVRVMRPRFDKATPHNAFDPAFLERWRGVTCVRFMDWMRTNNSPQARWQDRPKLTDATFRRGAPLELMVSLVNEWNCDAWFNMPHLADDEYVAAFAKMVKDRLAPHLKAYVEFSNEVWNFQFGQTRTLNDEAKAQGMSLAALTAQRSMRVHRIWQEVFGGVERFVRVLPSQAANAGLSEQILKHEGAYKRADVLSIAPYFGPIVQPSGSGPVAAEVERWSVDMLLDYVEEKSLPEAVQSMRAQKALADRYGLKLVAYEGGQHLVGALGAENNETLTRLLQAANAHPRMGKIYERYFDAWQQAGGDLMCHYNSMGTWTEWGSWGLLQHTLEDPRRSPKFMATMGWARKLGQQVKVPA